MKNFDNYLKENFKVNEYCLNTNQFFKCKDIDYGKTIETMFSPKSYSTFSFITINKPTPFGDKLIKLEKKYNKKSPELYKKCRIPRKIYNKVLNNRIEASKLFISHLVIGLEMEYDEAMEVFKEAGRYLSNSFIEDMIIDYALKQKIYDMNEIEETYYEYVKKGKIKKSFLYSDED